MILLLCCPLKCNLTLILALDGVIDNVVYGQRLQFLTLV